MSLIALLTAGGCKQEAATTEADLAKNEKADAMFSKPGEAAEQASAPGPGRTIIDVNGEKITEADFAAAIEALPDRMKPTVQSAAGRRALADELVRLKLLEQEGRRMGVEKETDVARAIEMSTANIIATAALRKLAEAEPTEAELRTLYEQNRKQYEVVRARQITIAYQGGAIQSKKSATPSEAAAREAAAKAAQRLRAGESFDKVAADVSDDPMLGQSGGLMVLRRGEVPESVEKAVFGAKDGAVTEPVKSDIGYHVFQVLKTEIPEFDTLRPMLERQARSTRVEQLVEQLRGKAKVNLDDSFIENPGTTAASSGKGAAKAAGS